MLFKNILYIFGFLVFLEFIIFFILNILKSKIPWIILDKDEYPLFKKNKIKLFIKKTFHPVLGWNWKPFTKHEEKIFSKTNKIFFGKFGERVDKKSFKKYSFASFGDSFVFCRYVKNNETWQSYLSKYISTKGLNFGVGNYGLDQAYIKYKTTKFPKNVKKIFIGFVPETLSRCLCSWKHYHEFNNIYAFKPKFLISKNKLKFIKNPIKDINSFNDMNKIISKLQKNEYFYKEKFLKNKLSFPFLFTILRNPSRNLRLIFYSFISFLNIDNNKIYEFIIKQNCIENDNYYEKKNNKLLIEKLFLKFKKFSKYNNQKIYFLIFPQKHDLFLKKKNYHHFFLQLKKRFNVIDFTEIFRKYDLEKIYFPDQYGGHLTAYGNKIVANELKKKFS